MNLFTKATAGLSDCGRYRYWLRRQWDDARPTLCWVMLNPSTADAQQDDPTIRRCCRFAWDWGFGAISVFNLFSWRATDPQALLAARAAGENIVGAKTDVVIREGVRHRRVICAWGAFGSEKPEAMGRVRAMEVLRLLRDSQALTIECLDRTGDGSPRHPLYVAATTQPTGYMRCDLCARTARHVETCPNLYDDGQPLWLKPGPALVQLRPDA